MKRIATQGSDTAGSSIGNHGAQFTGARDARKRRVPGIYVRNGRFYGQLWVTRDDGGKTARKFPLADGDGQPVRTVAEAKLAMDLLRHERREDRLPPTGHKPKFAEYVATYFAKAEVQLKKVGTRENETQALGRWQRHFGDVRIDNIKAPMIAAFKDKRLHDGASARTVNLDQIALRNVLKWAVADGLLRELPTSKKLKETQPAKKRLATAEEVARLLAAIPGACRKNADQFHDYVSFLAYSGAREQEALKVRWSDVDFAGNRVTLGTGGVSKSSKCREVDFNPKLGALLHQMRTRRAPDSTWLFPSPQRGTRDEHSKTFRESLNLARKTAGLGWVGFHHLRHYFASAGVMAGLDYMTVATWLGHSDGGILVGKVYGHLSETHRREAASKLRL